MSTCLEEDDGYDSVGEEAELELSCALHDLALRVKSFEENMRDRFHAVNGDDDDEISEDIPEMDGDHCAASPKRSARGGGRKTSTQQVHRQRAGGGGAKASKQQQQSDDDDDDMYNDDDDDDEDGGYDSDDEDSAEDETQSDEKQPKDWDFQEQKEELSEMRHNIALLLQGMKAEAKALESHELATDDNQ